MILCILILILAILMDGGQVTCELALPMPLLGKVGGMSKRFGHSRRGSLDGFNAPK